MGKKSKKQKEKRVESALEQKELSKPAKKEVLALVNSLLELCSKPIPPGPKEIEDFEEIYNLVQQIRSLQTEVNIEGTSREKSFNQFLDWLHEHGVDTSAVEIADFPHVGYGLKAVKDLKESDSIVNIPRKIMLTTATARDSPLGLLIKEDKILQAMPSIVLALHLLCEKRSKESFWKPYLNILPSSYTTPLYFSTDEMKLLKGSPAHKDCVNQFRNIARQYSYLYRVLQTHPAASKLPIKDHFTYDDYRWAVSTVMTRQNQIPTPDGDRVSFALIPMWDMCNHCNGTISTDYNMETDCSECFALREFKLGQQIYIFYGARSNAEFLIHSGFVFPENELDRTAIKLGISKGDSLFNSKADLLSKLGLEVSRTFFLHRGHIPVDPQILAFLRVFCMTQDDFEGREFTQEVLESLGDADSPLTTANEIKVWSFLQTRSALLLKAYDTTSEEDEKLLQSEQLSQLQQLIINLRLCEKHILQATQVFSKTKIATLQEVKS